MLIATLDSIRRTCCTDHRFQMQLPVRDRADCFPRATHRIRCCIFHCLHQFGYLKVRAATRALGMVVASVVGMSMNSVTATFKQLHLRLHMIDGEDNKCCQRKAYLNQGTVNEGLTMGAFQLG